MSINLKIPDIRELKPRLTVFGVGGAGGNAVNNMVASKLEGVEFLVAEIERVGRNSMRVGETGSGEARERAGMAAGAHG